ncbi:MAG: TolC family protein [Bacteroidales bacterium]
MSILLLSWLSSLSAQQRDLNFYLEQAKINSPLINKNKNESKIVTLDLKQINSVLSKPEVNLISGVMFAPIISHDNNSSRFELVSDGATDYTGYDLALTDGGHYQAVVSVKQPLFTGSRYKTYANKASISGQINDNNIALTVHEMEQIVGYQYILCIKSKMQINNELLLLKELDEQVKRMERLVENAVYKQTDLMLLQIEIQNYEAEYKMFRGEYMANIYDLNLICGIRDTSRVDLREIDFVLKPDIVLSSNFLTAYKLDSLNIIADRSINDLKYKPQLDLFADAGLFAAYLPYPDRIGFSTGISLSWNIFDGHQRTIQREKSDINLQTIEFEKKNFMTQNDINKNKILNQIEAVDQRLRLFEQQADQYDKLYNAYSKELSSGEASVMDFKNLLKDIAAKKQETLLLKMERQLLINSYNYLTY